MTAGGADPQRPGIPLGRIAGVPITLAWSWFIIAAAIVLIFGPQVAVLLPGVGAGAYAVAFGYAVLLLLSVLVHELAHALCARAYGWPTTGIVLTLWGGHTQFGHVHTTPWRSLAVAMAGPGANFLLAGLGWVLMFLAPDTFAGGTVAGLLGAIFVWANLLVAIFNSLPGMPLDGGRIVETLVWKATGSQEKGMVAAGWAGRVLVIGLLIAVFTPSLRSGEAPGLQLVLVAALVSGFLWMGAGAAVRNGRLRQRLPAVSAGALMRPAVGIRSGAPVRAARELHARYPDAALVVTAPTGQPEALVDAAALAQVPAQLADTTPINAAARALAAGAYVPDAARGEELVQYLSRLSGGEYAVINRDGAVVGLLHEADVVRAVTGRG